MAASRYSKPWLLYLGAGTVLIPLYFAFPAGGSVQSVIYEGIGGAAAIAILWAVRLHRPAKPLPWYLLFAAIACFVTGDVIAIFDATTSMPSPSDGFYLAGYPFAAGGLSLLMLSAGGRNRLAAIADAGMFAFAFAIFQWTFVMKPAIDDSNGTAATIVVALYPAMDVVLLAGLVGFFISPAWRTRAFALLTASIAILLVGDEIYGLSPASYRVGSWLDFTWMLSYLLVGTAALHPSMRELSEPRRIPGLRLRFGRLAMFTAALLVAPVTLFIQQLRGRPLELYEIVALATAISLLVVARLAGILRALERIRLRERNARAAAEDMQAQLTVQNEKLIEADRLKDEFVALISHDLRTPLTSIIGYVELALDDDTDPPLDDERRGYLEVVSRGSERLLRLIDDLLFVARLQAGRLVLTPTTLDLGEIARQALDEARPRAERKRLELAFAGDDHVPILADRGRVFQLLDNLISNALKFTPEGGRVEVRAVRAADGAVLEVSDTGIGLPPAELERIFDRFFRSERAVDSQIPGTGLGLFIAKAIAEAHGGRISASSRDGSGTTFRIELPAHAGRDEPVPEEELVA
ncbi:MAG TPA: HAMP domain-containing sensor histidine kinase [Gaiellaceae bacterium]